jgi:sulfite dehydrogenase (cytochrome) subunit B
VRATGTLLLSGAALLLGAEVAAADSGEAGVHLKPGAGSALTSSRCIICHSLEYIPANAPAMDPAAWQKTVQKMRDRFGAPINEEEARTILSYLSANYAEKT